VTRTFRVERRELWRGGILREREKNEKKEGEKNEKKEEE